MGPVGLSEAAESLYRDVVAGGIRAAAAAAPDAVAELLEFNLVTQTDGVLAARSPRQALAAEVAALESQRLGLEDLSSLLSGIWDEVHSAPEVDVVVGSQIGNAFGAFLTTARREVVACSIDPGPSGGSFSMPETQPSSMLRGIDVRGLYEASVLQHRTGLDVVRDSVQAGEQARVLPKLPVAFIVADGESAGLVPPYELWGRRQLLVTRHQGLVDSLSAIFELMWSLAIEIPPATWEAEPEADPDTVESGQNQLLVLLSTGLGDHAIARELGISERTLRRRIAELQVRLGAQNRFQLGYQAARLPAPQDGPGGPRPSAGVPGTAG